uniref:Transporter n=1 Tax=Strongyloides venezuelensis TaxID=75913 RepID=A0A0K0G5L2_STRVS
MTRSKGNDEEGIEVNVSYGYFLKLAEHLKNRLYYYILYLSTVLLGLIISQYNNTIGSKSNHVEALI